MTPSLFFLITMWFAASLSIHFTTLSAVLGPTMICGMTAFVHKKTGGGWAVVAMVGLIIGHFGNTDPNVRLYATIAYTLSPVTGFLASQIDSLVWKSESRN